MRFKFNSNSTATRNAIYMNAGSVINVKNGSHLEIIAETTTNAKGQGIQLDNTNKSFINVTGGSTLLIDGTIRGYVNNNIYLKLNLFPFIEDFYLDVVPHALKMWDEEFDNFFSR